MPLLLAIAGLRSSEQTALVSVLRAKADALSCSWSLFSDPASFPERPDAVLYCPEREEGQMWAKRLRSRGALPIAAPLAQSSAPSDSPLFARMPFRPQQVVDALNAAAKRIQAEQPEESPSAPKSGREERVELRFDFKNAQRVSSLSLCLFAVFQNSDQSQFFKLRSKGPKPREIWCWPDRRLYWSALPESVAAADHDSVYEVFNCSGKKEALAQKQNELRSASGLLWIAGSRAFKTAETLPWFALDARLSLARWPDIPKAARSVQLIRVLARLTRSEPTFSELLAELHIGRRDLCSALNGLIMSGCLRKTREPALQELPVAERDPEEALFLKSLGLRCTASLEQALAAAEPEEKPE